MNVKTERNNKKKTTYLIGIVLIVLVVSMFYKFKNKDTHSTSSYLEEEIASSIEKVKKNQNLNTVSIGFMTDLHMNEQEEELCLNNIKAFTDISNTGLLDFSVNGGDLYYGTWKNREEGKVNLKYVKLLFSNINIPMLYARGNHDCNIKKDPDEAISNQDYYNIMLKHLEGEVTFNDKEPYGGYYYKDLEEQKIRVCILNAFNGENYQYIFGDTQLEFIATNVLNFENKENAEDWQVIFFTHTIESSITHPESVEDKEKFYEILTAYKDASVVEINNKKIDYSKQGNGTVIAIISGHHHMDLSDNKNGIPIIMTTSASSTYSREYTYEEVVNTKNELAFDILTIDSKKRTINITRLGRGEDREISY